MNSVLFSVVFASLTTVYQVETAPQNDVEERSAVGQEAQFYCDKFKSCTPGGPKVCGFDQYKPWLAEFEDICILYRTNCAHIGRFYPVDQVVCDTRIKYDKEHENETFEVHTSGHTPTTVASTTHPGPNETKTGPADLQKNNTDKYYFLYAAYHCHKKLKCKPGGGWVCAIYRGEHASFPDKCHFHGANCLRQGVYWQISTADCKPVVKFVEACTAYHNQRIYEYSTEASTTTEGSSTTEQSATTEESAMTEGSATTEGSAMTDGTRLRHQKQAKIAVAKSSIFAKIKDFIGISANFSMQY